MILSKFFFFSDVKLMVIFFEAHRLSGIVVTTRKGAYAELNSTRGSELFTLVRVPPIFLS